MKQEIRSERVRESYQKIDHPSGLTLLLYPMEGFSSAYAMLTTDYGSVDMAFRTDPKADFTRIPAGTAHFLEHKMFENEDGDAFAKYAATGASANAFTSFDKTSYLFGCADHFEESLRILLEFVTTPYFTPQTVSKEQGIIGQEIKMYDDNPDWRVLFNLLKAMYVKHPIAIDIAGTVESIAEITADSLYETYHAFYNLHNMVLVVAGNADPEAEDYRSLTDFCCRDGVLEIRIPWQLLNVMDPSGCQIMDDLYALQDIVPTGTDAWSVGMGLLKAGAAAPSVSLNGAFSWKGWTTPTYHERLKPAYYELQEGLKEFQ